MIKEHFSDYLLLKAVLLFEKYIMYVMKCDSLKFLLSMHNLLLQGL